MSVAVDLLPVETAIPASLRASPRWIVSGRDKRPIQTDGRPASTTDPSTWTTYETALAAARRLGCGVGYVLDDEEVCIDLDHALGEDGALTPEAAEIVAAMRGWTEVSRSGRGIHVWVRGRKPAHAGSRRAGIEVYGGPGGRYIAVTGRVLIGCDVEDLPDRQAEVEALCARLWPHPASTPPRPEVAEEVGDDAELLRRAVAARNGAKLRRLLDGDTSGYASASEADAALAASLAFWSRDPAQIERIMRSSRLAREKWEERRGEETYIGQTIRRAMQTVSAHHGDRESAEAARPSNPSIRRPRPWPHPPAPEAYYGIVGDFVRAVAPFTEADSFALLLSSLTACGSSIGRGPHIFAGASAHHVNLNALMVGRTSKGRKGTSWDYPRTLLAAVDPAWEANRITSGLGSGEGLIWAVRDAIKKREPIREKRGGLVTGYQDVIVDDGIEDKRLLVVASEFTGTMRVCARESCTLSPVIRDAWDGVTLRVTTKNNPACATRPHVSIIGHAVADEFLRYCGDSEIAGGLVNRFLIACVRRAQELPETDLSWREIVDDYADRLKPILEAGRAEKLYRFDDAARKHWHEVYHDLSAEVPGLLGAATARAEAQTLRLALLYAVLDGASSIGLPHLRAALALWDYCRRSAEYVFGDRLGDPIADEIMTALRRVPRGLTRTQIREVVGHHVPADRIATALMTLLERGHATITVEDSGGRPVERWTAAADGVSSLSSHISRPDPVRNDPEQGEV